MYSKKGLSITIGLVVLAALLAFMFPTTQAAAQTPTPQPKAPQAAGARADRRLEKLFRAAQKWLDRQEKNLAHAGQISANASDRIAKLKAAGKDTTALETALAQFQKNIAQAQQKHDTAAAILSAHAGFDANGKVTDRAAARETLKSANAPLREARRLIVEALKIVRDAVRSVRQAKP